MKTTRRVTSGLLALLSLLIVPLHADTPPPAAMPSASPSASPQASATPAALSSPVAAELEGFEKFKNTINLSQNEELQIKYRLLEPKSVKLDVQTLKGQPITTLDAGDRPAGVNTVNWKGVRGTEKLAAGVYVLKLVLPNRTYSRKVVLLK